ncbi:MAG: cysteine--tRNA ligase, partial [Cetobacterium sp.]
SNDGISLLKEIEEYIVDVMENVLGVLLKVEAQVGNLTGELVEFILELRKDARDSKDWAVSDKIRDRLLEMGIKIKDGKDRTTWSI